jgi:hypothetical protein
MNQLHCRHSILEATPQGTILEVAFSGVHEHGVGLQVGKYVEETVHQTNPTAVVLNFLEFEYVFGNDIAGIQWAFFNRSVDKRITIRPCAIVAKGQTAKSLLSLIQSGNLLRVFDIQFAESIDAAVEQLRSMLVGASESDKPY